MISKNRLTAILALLVVVSVGAAIDNPGGLDRRIRTTPDHQQPQRSRSFSGSLVDCAVGGWAPRGASGRPHHADGMKVDDRPVAVSDLIATIALALGIDPMEQNASNVQAHRFALPILPPNHSGNPLMLTCSFVPALLRRRPWHQVVRDLSD